ncbi:hypothetical protein HZU77_000975 [Neisseriaceae bacterium TC5R-5]|nr:hypothetical protein [Neisseriaceae bacterium TC5R-5]
MNAASAAMQLDPNIHSTELDTLTLPWLLLTDVEYFSHQLTLHGASLKATQQNCVNATLPLTMESMLPQIRTLAILLAAKRQHYDHTVIAAQLSEPADWLAARILLLQISHIAIDLQQLIHLDLANQRAANLSQKLNLVFTPALPVLVNHNRPKTGTITLLPIWSSTNSKIATLIKQQQDTATLHRKLQTHCQQSLQNLLTGLF